MLESIYQALILEHYRRPRNRGRVEEADASVHLNNPTCGDEIELSLRVEDGVIREILFAGSGCAISQASASMMVDRIAGKPIEEADALLAAFRALMRGDAEGADPRRLGDLRALAGVARLPGRVRCAMLGWNAFEELKRVVAPTTAPQG